MNDLLMLALLLEAPQHGYALKKRAGLISGQGELHNNIVYPLLRRFVKEGWVTQRKAGGERGQTRVMYALRAAGRKAIEERASEFGAEEAASEGKFRLRVGLFSILDAATRAKVLDARQAFLEREAQKYGAMKEQIKFETFSGEVVRWIREGIKAELDWIERLRRMSRMDERGNGRGKGGKRR